MKKIYITISLILLTNLFAEASKLDDKSREKKFEIKITPPIYPFFLLMFESELNYRWSDKLTLGVSYGTLILDPQIFESSLGVPILEKIQAHARYFSHSNQGSSFYTGLAPAIIKREIYSGKKELAYLVMPVSLGLQWTTKGKSIVVSSEINVGASYDLIKKQIKPYGNFNIMSVGMAV